jgi:hypothetical protein
VILEHHYFCTGLNVHEHFYHSCINNTHTHTHTQRQLPKWDITLCTKYTHNTTQQNATYLVEGKTAFFIIICHSEITQSFALGNMAGQRCDNLWGKKLPFLFSVSPPAALKQLVHFFLIFMDPCIVV